MSWEFVFALMKHFYHFSHEELCNLTVYQINMYMSNMGDVHMFMQGEKKKEDREKIQKRDLIILIKQMGHKCPSGM